MNQRLDYKKYISMALFLTFVGALVWYVTTNWDEISGLLTLSQGTVMILLGLGLLSALINGVYHLVILRTFDLSLSVTDWMGVTCVCNAIAYVVPMRAELVLAANYYKRVKGLAYTKSVAMTAGNLVFGVSFSLIQILAAMLCVGLIDGKWPLLIWAVTAIGFVGIAVFVFVALASESRMRRWLEKRKTVRDIIEGFNALLRNRRLLLELLVCMTASNLVRIFMIMVCFQASGQAISLYEALLYASLAWLTTIIAVVPGNIGLKESIMGVATLQLGVDFAVGVTASLLERVTMMIVYVVLGLIFAAPVWVRYNKKDVKNV